MKEIGGYIEFERNSKQMLYEEGMKLNCGRNALAYLLLARGIKKLAMPYFMCNSCDGIINKHHVSVRYYHIDWNFSPTGIKLEDDEWLYLVNFYGQLSNQFIQDLVDQHTRIIVDNVQAYFQPPIPGVDTIYSCRKFFGVADGAVLFTEKRLNCVLEQDESFERMRFLLGRFERTASEFYSESVANNELFEHEPLKQMSKLTENLLRGVNYEEVKRKRVANFSSLHELLGQTNKLEIRIPDGPFMYPFYTEHGAEIRKELQKRNIYIPTLWPNVLQTCGAGDLEYQLAENILPLPCDQRYDREDMEYVCHVLQMEMKKHGCPEEI